MYGFSGNSRDPRACVSNVILPKNDYQLYYLQVNNSPVIFETKEHSRMRHDMAEIKFDRKNIYFPTAAKTQTEKTGENYKRKK